MKNVPALALSVAVSLALGLGWCATASAMPAPQDHHAAHVDGKPVVAASPAEPAPAAHAQHNQASSHAHDPKSHAGNHPDAPGNGMSIPADHVKWTPDAPLMEGMEKMHDAIKGLHHHEMGHLDDTQVDQLATQVDEAAAFMFANCKLDAEPDVALHGILARLMAGAEALHADPADPAPVADMHAALQDYPKLFNDPGFAAADEGEEDDDAG